MERLANNQWSRYRQDVQPRPIPVGGHRHGLIFVEQFTTTPGLRPQCPLPAADVRANGDTHAQILPAFHYEWPGAQYVHCTAYTEHN